jgi:hypothetical protein
MACIWIIMAAMWSLWLHAGNQRSVEASQAMMRAIVGLTGRKNAYRIAPAWLVPEGYNLTKQLIATSSDGAFATVLRFNCTMLILIATCSTSS